MTRTVLLGDVVQINPSTPLKKGASVTFVSMDKLDAFKRKINGYEKREFKGGAKFINGDTLLARITPCLENGKTAYVDILHDNEVGAGSTEFIILRAINGVTDSDYIYYLSISPSFREFTIQAMIGTSGRQRVQNDVLAKYEFDLPDIEEQRAIGQQLKLLDEKIELNRKMNETLEQIGQALFKKYFITNPAAKGVSLENIADLERGVEPGSKNYSTEKSDGSVPFLRVGDLSQRSSNLFVSTDLTKAKTALPTDILVSFDGAPGLVGIGFSGCYSSGIRKITPKNDDISKAYLYFLMKSPEVQEVIDRYSEGTTIKHASKSISHIIAPYVAGSERDLLLSTAFEQLINNIKEIDNLTTLRDTLLPRLISGKLKV